MLQADSQGILFRLDARVPDRESGMAEIGGEGLDCLAGRACPFSDLLERRLDGIAVVRRGRIRYVNQTVRRLCGMPSLSGPLVDFAESELFQLPAKQGSAANRYRCQLRRASGRLLPVEIQRIPFQMPDEAAELLLIRDLSLQIANERDFADMVQGLIASSDESLFQEVTTSLQRWLSARLIVIAEYQGDELVICSARAYGRSAVVHPQQGCWPQLRQRQGPCLEYSSDTPVVLDSDWRSGDGWMGQNLCGHDGVPIGLLLSVSRGPQYQPPFAMELLAIAATRVQAELVRRRNQRELERQQELALRSERLRGLGRMATGMAHEFTQPMTVIRALAEQSRFQIDRQQRPDDEQLQRRFQLIMDQVDRLCDLIDHLRAFGNDSGSRQGIRIDLRTVVEAVLRTTRARLMHRGIQIDWTAPDEEHWVVGNPFDLEEALQAVVINSAEVMEQLGDGQERRLHLRLSATAEKHRLDIEDTGPGISEPDKACEPFYTTKAEGGHIGMGLTTVGRICAAHAGRLLVAKGRSSCQVSLILPRSQVVDVEKV